MTEPKRPHGARKDLGHTEPFMVKLHPDLKAHVESQAAANYCSGAEFVRRLIIADKRQLEATP